MTDDEERISYVQGIAAGDAPLDAFDERDLDALMATLADPTTWEEPPAGLGDRIVAAISADAGASAGTRGPANTATAAPAAAPADGRRRRYGWAGPALIGAAAAAALTFGLTRIGNDNSSTRSADGTITLTGTELQPAASGTAGITSLQSGVRIDFNVPGLPRRDGNEFYEAWLKSVDGTKLVPVGTFHQGDHVTLWAGVPIADYPILTVTQETVAGPKDPLQGSSGLVVVKGQLTP